MENRLKNSPTFLTRQDESLDFEPLTCQDTNKAKVKFHFDQLRNLFIFDAIIFVITAVLLCLFSFGVVSVTKVLYLGIPFFCVFLSNLFFFGYIMWFDNGFKSDDEYTLEELKEFEVNYLTKGGYKLYYKKVNNNQSVLSNGDNFNSEIDLEGRKKEDTSFMQGFEQDPINFD
jgi:hypothetical protein